MWDHPGTKACHQIMLEGAIVANDERLLSLQELCDESGAPTKTVRERLEKLEGLRRDGLIDEDDYEQQKDRILNDL